MSADDTGSASWSERLFGGFRKTSEKLTENLAGIVAKARLDEAQLDELEDALILSDLGPRAAARIRAKLAGERFEKGADEAAIRAAVAEEIAAILRPVAKPLDVVAFPRPQVILVIGVNGSGKTTTIAKLAHLFQELEVLAERDGTGHAPNFARVQLPPGTHAGTLVTVTPTRIVEGLLA